MTRTTQALLAARLEARRPEIESTLLSRAHAVADPVAARDPAYMAGLETAVSAALGYGLAAIAAGGAGPGPIPGELFAQARHAARTGVKLDTVLRRYFAGHALLIDFMMQEAQQSELFEVEELKALGMSQAMLVDRVVAAIAEEYRSEAGQQARTREQVQLDCVRRLLSGESIDTSQLSYDFDLWHIAAIAVGEGAERTIRAFAGACRRRLLLVPCGEQTFWAWMGSAHQWRKEDFDKLSAWRRPPELRLSTGEPAQGLRGWCFTHEQAAAALPVAMRGESTHVRYADVALLTSMVKDEIVVRSLNDLYLDPLAVGVKGEETLRETLRAYFSAQRNVSSTAAALGVNRKTVNTRLRAVERRLGRPLNSCAAELELALRFEKLGDPPKAHSRLREAPTS